MRRLGSFVSKVGAVGVVRCDDVDPCLDADVYDASLDKVGRVVDFFGPVERPYAVVEMSRTVEKGSRLYTNDAEN